ncbi:MAG: YebC/PmpR family DNA-binding transcriptional regulator [Candidatus Curtissbacteria bacterium]|nr:YebC/PmpR family DNA-binding transcriptional regulator [Candidatus Curtissbacteria bacterium]
MSGHSKWSQIKRQKGVADVKRGATFTKAANAITVAAREGGGGDPASNFKLRLVMEHARAVNMPKDIILRAIDRGLSKGLEGALDSVTYEGYGPGKVALVIEAVTDNKNRTTPEVKNVLEKSGGSFVTPGTVSWMFSDCGLITLAKNGKSYDELFEAAVDAGADDVLDSDDAVEIYTKPNELDKVKNALAEKGFAIQSAELARRATTTVEVSDPQTQKKIFDVLERLEDLDDVQKVWSNFEIIENPN